MDMRRFEALLRETLEEKSEPVSMPEARKEQIHQAIREQIETTGQTGVHKEETVMRLGFKRKVILVAAAMCMFGTVAALASGKVVSYYSSHSADKPDYKTFAELSAVEEDTGFAMKAVEQFDNGYRFEKGFKIDVKGADEGGNVMETFPEVSLEYKNGSQRLTVTAKKVSESDTIEGDVTSTEYKGRTLQYKEDHYLLVPPSYEPSEEELKAQEAGELYISYGTDEVENKTFHFMQWDDNGTHYLIMSYEENAPGQEEMAKMAQAIIDSAE